jgi:uncharacterized protein (DUF2141 family)
VDTTRPYHRLSGSLPRIARLLGVSCAIGFGVRCAHVEPPSGGPVDATPPAVAAVYPAPNALGVPRDARVVFQFNEWIDRVAARNQVLVSPPYRGRTRLEVEGDRLTVLPPAGDGFRPNTTHVVTVLGTLKDLRTNPMGREFTLRFSTGTGLDSATVGGTLTADTRRGRLMAALLTAIPLTARDSTLKPWSDLPAWIAAADSAGNFKADGAPAGDYALFAFEDLNGNFTFDLGFEHAATGPASLAVRPRAPDQRLRLTALDTLPLRISLATFESDIPPEDSAATITEYPGTVHIQFTRPPHPFRAAEASRYRILPDSGAPLAVRSASWDPAKGTWVLETPPLRANGRYRVELRGRPDFPGRPGLFATDPNNASGIDTSVLFIAERSGTVGSTPAAWTLSPLRAGETTGPNGLSQSASAPPTGAGLTFGSNLPLSDARWSRLEKGLAATFAGDSVPVTVRARRLGATSLSLQLSRPLRYSATLELKLAPAPGDTTRPHVLYSGKAYDSLQVGSVRATVVAAAGKVLWLRSRLESNPAEYTLVRTGDALKSNAVPAGRYSLYGFLDRDGDGIWDSGALRPWIAQEPFESLLDTVTVLPGESVDVTDRIKPK